MGHTENFTFDLVLPKDSIKSFKKMITGSLSDEIWEGFFGGGDSDDDSDWILEGSGCSAYKTGKLEDEDKLPQFYKDFLLKPPKDYETITVEFSIKGWFEEGIQGLLRFLQQISDDEALLIAGGNDDEDPYKVLFEVKDIKKLKEEKKGKRSNKESATIRCVICNEEDRSVLFGPCTHVATCEECSYKSSTCPFCKVKVEKRVKVLLS